MTSINQVQRRELNPERACCPGNLTSTRTVSTEVKEMLEQLLNIYLISLK
jgi:hypothetical protein